MTADLSSVDIQNLTDEQIMEMELGFFKKLKEVDTNRDYTIIVDRSGSMSGSNWIEAREAVAFLAPHACKCDPEGITLYFFDYEFQKFSNIKSVDNVLKCFEEVSPRGTTDLARVLADAVPPDGVTAIEPPQNACICICCCPCPNFSQSHAEYGPAATVIPVSRGKPTTILVITDGSPDDRNAVEKVIIHATKKYMSKDDDLSISIIQVGDDYGADLWLQELDGGLTAKGARFDNVDVMSLSMMKGISFSDLIKKSLSD